MLSITGLNKAYSNNVQALSNINLDINKGMFGLLGPNGAGKSTLLRTIATLQEPDTGTIHFDDIDVINEKTKMRRILGYLPQEFGIYPSFSAENLLDHLALLKGILDRKARKQVVASLLDITNLTQHKNKKLGGFSGGMKQRFGIAQVLIGNPKIIILDEPTAGLDPQERDRFYNILSYISEHVTVILSTHIVSDVTELCSDMAIINNGQLLIKQPPLMAIEQITGKIWKINIEKSDAELFSKQYKIVSQKIIHGKIMVKIFSEAQPASHFVSVIPDLEDVYFSFMNGYVHSIGQP